MNVNTLPFSPPARTQHPIAYFQRDVPVPGAAGDSPRSIAQKFDIQSETILWANENLNAMAGKRSIVDTVNILPVNGVLHTSQDGDMLEILVRLHETPAPEILEYFGYNFDVTEPPQLTVGKQDALDQVAFLSG